MTPQSRALADALQALFPWHLARIKFVASFILTLLVLNTVNLTKLAGGLNGLAKRSSNYRRLQRFFKDFDLDQHQIATWVLAWVGAQGSFIVSIDRTNWQLGTININILMIGVVYQGIVIPLAWQLLDKRGNSNTAERKQLLNKLLAVLPISKIMALVGDREFIGSEWFGELEQNRLRYAIRIKDNAVVLTAQGPRPLRHLFRDLAVGCERHLRKPRWVYSHRLYLSVLRLSHDELLIVATQQKRPDTLALYAQRWGIEVLFSAFKSRGFDLEQTHLTHHDRLDKLIALLALAMTWAVLVGLWEAEHKAIRLKKHGRKAKSLFRTGLDQLQYVVLNAQKHMLQFSLYLDLIRTPELLTS